ncbi:MAG: ABC transporter permease [Nitrospirae bacterium]|nr:ABC transporter permease [Candidatus Manganitrophaceae bacterium]
MIRNILILSWNDLAIAFKNKTIYLIFFIPLFVFLTLKFVDQTDTTPQKIKIGLIEKENYAPVILKSIQSADQAFSFIWLSSREAGKRGLKEKKVDGILIPSEKEPKRLELVVLTKTSLQTVAIVESLSALQIAVEGKNPNWLSSIQPLQENGIQKQTLPTWILMLALMVSFIILPAQVAEEKEKNLLLGLLQTPIRETEWLVAKLILGMCLIGISVIFLHLLGKFDLGFSLGLGYALFVMIGSFCFSAVGVFLGFLCRNQASARTLGVLVYLPHLLPSALSDFSQKLNKFAPLLPSFQFYAPIKSILFEGIGISHFYWEVIYLLSVGIAAHLFSYKLMKIRWLM